jgi:hypothetical protein
MNGKPGADPSMTLHQDYFANGHHPVLITMAPVKNSQARSPKGRGKGSRVQRLRLSALAHPSELCQILMMEQGRRSTLNLILADGSRLRIPTTLDVETLQTFIADIRPGEGACWEIVTTTEVPPIER